MSMILFLKSATDSEIDNLIKDPEEIEEFIDSAEDSGCIDLDKAWHGIHFLLTNSAWEGPEPYCYLLAGGETIGDIDVGYGPARAFSSQQVADFDSALEKIDEAEFRKRFEPKLLTSSDIYPSIWDRPLEEDDTLGYISSYFEELKKFLKETGKTKNGLIVWMG